MSQIELLSDKFDNALYNAQDSIQIDTSGILESRPESPIKRAIQTQEVSHLAQMIDTKEALGLSIGVSAHEPRQPEGSRVKRPTGIRSQKSLDVRVVHLGT
jgi:hypothetical protein